MNSNTGTKNNIIDISKLNDAIKNRKRVSFIYQNKLRKVYPMGIKLFNNSWYLGAEDNNKLKTFSLNKINNLKIGNKSELHDKDYKKIKFSWENKDYQIIIKLNLKKELYLINKNIFNHSIISKNQKSNLLKLEISTYDVSDIYSKNGEYFFDFDLDSENNKILFYNSVDIFDIETITDLELFKLYTLFNTIDLHIDIDTLTKKDINTFIKILKSSFKIYDLENDHEIDNKNINLNEITTIEYIKLGNSTSYFYEVEPLLITSTLEGSVLEALDLNDKKIKTFLINRIISIGESVKEESKKNIKQTEIEVIFEAKDDSVLSKFKEIRKQNNKYVAKFRNKDIAVEFFIENFTSARVISPDIVKVDVIKRVESIRELLKI